MTVTAHPDTVVKTFTTNDALEKIYLKNKLGALPKKQHFN